MSTPTGDTRQPARQRTPVTERPAAPRERYETCHPRGCCKGASRGRVLLTVHQVRHVTFHRLESTCCGRVVWSPREP